MQQRKPFISATWIIASSVGGLLSVTEGIADPHYRSRAVVLRPAAAAGFREHQSFGSRLSFTLNLDKPHG